MLSLEAKENKERFKSVSFLPKKVGKITLTIIAFCLLFIMIGCAGESEENNDASPGSSAKAITEFSLNGFEGTINQTEKTITVMVPAGTYLSSMVATYTITGIGVVVNSNIQQSGITDNDFSTSPVIYTVVAENGTTQEYEVTVTEAPSSAKEMKTFALGTVSAPGVFVGTINEAAKTIEVLVPFGTNVTALVATFTIIGENVKIGLIVQESGTTVNDFTLPVVYTVTGADASTQDYTITVEDEPENKPATAVRVEMKPNNAGTSIPSGVFCSATPSITGSVFVTDSDGGSLVVTQWYDNNNLIPELTQTVTLPAGVTTYSQTIYDADGNRFRTGHVITFRATADGVPSNTATSGRIA